MKAKREMKKDLLALKRTKGADIKIDDKPKGKSLMKWNFLSFSSETDAKKMPVNLIMSAAVADQTWHII